MNNIYYIVFDLFRVIVIKLDFLILIFKNFFNNIRVWELISILPS